ncbi:MAG: M16 family metallopeptidase [Bacteroidales bacterium]
MSDQLPSLSAKQKTKIFELRNNEYFKISRYVLENGMQVILNPSGEQAGVAVAVYVRAGSDRDPQGKKGIAHLLEHLMFGKLYGPKNENFFTKIRKLGGKCNAYTQQSVACYHSLVPTGALESTLWLESERFKDISGSINQEIISNEVEVIWNEKMESLIGSYYLRYTEMICEHLFPKNHPYGSPIIGYLKDMRSISKEDIINFHRAFYIPSNTIIIISGDFQEKKANRLIQKYFGTIQNSHIVPPLDLPVLSLNETKKIAWICDFSCKAKTELYLGYCTPGGESKDCLAIEYFIRYMMDYNNSPLSKYLKGQIPYSEKGFIYLKFDKIGILKINFYSHSELEDFVHIFRKSLEIFENKGIDKKAMKFLHDSIISQFADPKIDPESRALSIGRDNNIYGCAHPIEVLEKYLAITPEEIYNAFSNYILDTPHVLFSIAKENTKKHIIKDSKIITFNKEWPDNASFVNRSVSKVKKNRPANSESESLIFQEVEMDSGGNQGPVIKSPNIDIISNEIWTKELKNSLKIFGITNTLINRIKGEVVFKGGYRCEPQGKSGLAFFYTEYLKQGTKQLRKSAFKKYLKNIDSTLSFINRPESVKFEFSCPPTNLVKLISLIEELILHPCFVARNLPKIKKYGTSITNYQNSAPEEIGFRETFRLMFGEKSTFNRNQSGFPEDFKNSGVEEVRWFYEAYITPAMCSFNFVGPIDLTTCESALASLEKNWLVKPVELPAPVIKDMYEMNKIYFNDYPASPQSTIFINYKTLPPNHPDFYSACFLCWGLGVYPNSLLNESLRRKASLTYNVYSYILSGDYLNCFSVYTKIASENTKNAYDIMRETLATFGELIDESWLEDLKNTYLSRRALKLNNPELQLSILFDTSLYDLPLNFFQTNPQTIANMTLARACELISLYFKPEDAYYFIVGDEKILREQFEEGEIRSIELKP